MPPGDAVHLLDLSGLHQRQLERSKQAEVIIIIIIIIITTIITIIIIITANTLLTGSEWRRVV